MADTKISALTSATTPLDGTEVLPIVQSSTTKKVANNDLRPKQIQSNATSGVLQIVGPAAAATRVMTVPDANFTAARTDAAQSFTGDQTLSTGNLIQGAAAKGFNFTANTPAAGMTSQLLNRYEEGTFTPTISGSTTAGTATYGSQVGRYTRIGRLVTVQVYITCSSPTGTGNLRLSALPFTAANVSTAYSAIAIGYANNFTLTASNVMTGIVSPNTTYINVLQYPVGGGSATSVPITAIGASTAQLAYTLTYEVA